MKLDEIEQRVVVQAAKIDSLQQQIVEQRMRMEQQAAANAALIDHAVAKAVAAEMGGRQISDAQHQWIVAGAVDAAERKRLRSAVLLHILQWGIGGTVGFALFSAWEQVKTTLGHKP